MKNTVKINESTLRKIVAESVKKVLSEIINPFDDGFGGVDTAMATSYSNKSIGNAWLKKAGMRRDMLQGGKPVPNNKEENESKINESTLRRIVAENIKNALMDLGNFTAYGQVLRAKGIVECEDGRWIHFDYIPGEQDVRFGEPAVTGMLCVIGVDIEPEAIREMFKLDE